MWAAEGLIDTRDRIEWNHTSSIMAMINNVHAVKKKDLVDPGHYNPYVKDKQRPNSMKLTRDSITMLKSFAHNK